MVCVSSGSTGGNYNTGGGGGGALSWATIPTTGIHWLTVNTGVGVDSFVQNSTGAFLVYAGAGQNPSGIIGGAGGVPLSLAYATGYAGGSGSSWVSASTGGCNAGGGAGGYSGPGGAGTSGGGGIPGMGGGGGGGVTVPGCDWVGRCGQTCNVGGGVGLFGEGPSGSGIPGGTMSGNAIGLYGGDGSVQYPNTTAYGGGWLAGWWGIGSAGVSLTGGLGGPGACRIIWGSGCTYPSNAGPNCYIHGR